MLLIDDQERDYIYNIKKPDGGVLRTNIILIGYIISQMRKGYSPIILVVGKQRIGKSFIAVWLAWRIHKFFHNQEEMKIKDYTYYDPITAIRRMEHMNIRPLIIDEAGAFLNKTEWYKKITIALDKIVQTQGYLCNCYIFVAPFGTDIAKTFRKHFSHLVHVRRRGVFSVKEIAKKYWDLSGKMPRTYTVEQVKVASNCIPIKIWKEYEEFSYKMKNELRASLERERESLVNKDYWNREIIQNAE